MIHIPSDNFALIVLILVWGIIRLLKHIVELQNIVNHYTRMEKENQQIKELIHARNS